MTKRLFLLSVLIGTGPFWGCVVPRHSGPEPGRTAAPDPTAARTPAGGPGEEAGLAAEKIGAMVRARLDNGLTILVDESHSAPVVAIQVWVAVGSADERDGEDGLAHLHEHMLFKGTTSRGVGEIARTVEAAGGEINAWTSFDQTVYHVVLASKYFDLGLEVLADAVQNATFDPAELEREKKVVLEEIKRTRDMPGRRLGELLFATAYKAHPYGNPVLGSARTVSGVTRKAIRGFFSRNYRPERMTLVVAGDVAAQQVLTRARALFATSKKARPRRAAREPEPEQRRLRVRIARDDIQEAHLGLAWHIPGVEHADIPALDVLATLLGQGESSRLNLGLRRGANLANDAYAYAYTPADPGLFVVGASCPVGSVERVLAQLAFEVGRLGSVPASATELAKVKSMVESDSLYTRETVQGQARRLGYYQVLLGDPRYGDRYLSQILGVGPEDLLRVAKTYLAPGRASVVLVLPEGDAAELDRKAIRAALDKGTALVPEPTLEPGRIEAGVTRVKIRNGPVVLIQEDHTNALVSIRGVLLGGVRYEDEQTSGIHNFLAGLLTRGTRTRSADDIAREIDAIAGSLDGFSGRNTIGLRADFPARYLDRGLALFADCLQNPSFVEAEIKRERELTLEEIGSRDDQLAGLAFDLFAATLYAEHPYRRSILGTRKSVAAFRRKQLIEQHGRVFDPARLVISVVGDVDAKAVLQQLRALFGNLERSRPAAERPTLKADPRPDHKRIAIKHRSRAQAHLVLGFMGTTLSSRDRFALEVLMAVLAGQGGRLFVELRDRRSLAYSVTGFSLEGMEPGYVAVYLGTDPGRVREAVDAVLAQLERIRSEQVPPAELERAQRYLVGTHAISLQRGSARAASLAFNELYGLGHLAHLAYADQIEAVTRADVLRVARKYLDLEAYVLTVVGPQDQLPALEAD